MEWGTFLTVDCTNEPFNNYNEFLIAPPVMIGYKKQKGYILVALLLNYKRWRKRKILHSISNKFPGMHKIQMEAEISSKYLSMNPKASLKIGITEVSKAIKPINIEREPAKIAELSVIRKRNAQNDLAK